MPSDDAVGLLVELGLTPSEARCYVSLLGAAPATAGELAKASGVARPKVYGTMKSLEQRRFCYPSGDRVTTYRPVDPDLALGEWTRTREHERRLQSERDSELRAELVEMLPHPPEPASERAEEALFELTGGLAATIEDYERLINQAGRRIDIVHCEPVLQGRKRWNAREVAALERGIQVRVLFATSELAKRHDWEQLVAAGGEVRVAAETSLKLVVRDDGAEAMIAVPDPGDPLHPYCLLVRNPNLIAPLQLSFNRNWRRGSSLARPRAKEGHRPSRTSEYS